MIKSLLPVVPESAWIAPTATVRGSVTLGEHVSVWFGAVMRGDDEPITIGANTNIQDGAILHVSAGFPCRIGENVTIGHRAIVHGCTVADGVLVGMGAIILDGAEIGSRSLVAAGAVVSPGFKVPPGSLVLGVPARLFGPLTPSQKVMGPTAVKNYLARKEAYRSGNY